MREIYWIRKSLSIALNHVSLNDVTDIWIELDEDDGQYIYEFSFKYNKLEYEFEINA